MKFKVICPVDMVYYNSKKFHCSVRQDVLDWLEKHRGKQGHYSSKHGWKGKWLAVGMGNESRFRFLNGDDAMLFKLTWGGK